MRSWRETTKEQLDDANRSSTSNPQHGNVNTRENGHSPPPTRSNVRYIAMQFQTNHVLNSLASYMTRTGSISVGGKCSRQNTSRIPCTTVGNTITLIKRLFSGSNLGCTSRNTHGTTFRKKTHSIVFRTVGLMLIYLYSTINNLTPGSGCIGDHPLRVGNIQKL